MMEVDLEHNHRATGEMRILLAVINMAVMDSCGSPGKTAMDAHDFLWGGRIETFLHYTDMDPEWFRRRLTEVMEDRDSGFKDGFYAKQKRAFRYNRRVYAKDRNAFKQIPYEEE